MSTTVYKNLFFIVIIGCGKTDKKPPSTSSTPIPQTTKIPTIPNISFSLAVDDADYKIDITNCTSGFTALNQSTSPILLYHADNNCTATLKEIKFKSEWWTAASGCCAPNTSVLFSSAAFPSQFLNVTKISDLPTPIINNGEVKFSFTHIQPGNTYNLIQASALVTLDSTNNSPLTDYPNFSLTPSDGVTLTNTAGDTGDIGKFKFKFTCNTALNDTNTICTSNANAQAHLISDLRTVLIKDTFAINHPDISECETALETTPASVSVLNKNLPTFNGGFEVELNGPGSLKTADNRKMIFILQYKNGTSADYSYLYTRVTFATN